MSENKCIVKTCKHRRFLNSEHCKKHYISIRKTGSESELLEIYQCTIPGCNKQSVGKGYCDQHYRSFSLYGDPLYIKNKKRKDCSISDCSNVFYAKGYCRSHYLKMRRNKEKVN